MPAPSMQFASGVDSFTFQEERLPLPMRRAEYSRKAEEASGVRKINCQLTGYFTGESGTDLRTRYDQLLAICACGSLTFTWFDGARTIIDQEVYIQGVSEPSQWGEYSADYTVDFYYYTCINPGLQLAASFQGASSYAFEITPLWSFTDKKNRSNPLTAITTGAGQARGSTVTLQLTGQVCADSAAALEVKRQALYAAFSTDGILNYGDFSTLVSVNSVSIPATMPKTHFDYTIDLSYFTSNLVNFRSGRSISRLSTNPIIHELENCSTTPIVKERYAKGQTIRYRLAAEGYSIAAVRALLANELAFMVIPGGVELPGGTEDQEDDPPSVSCNFSVYYPTPVIANL